MNINQKYIQRTSSPYNTRSMWDVTPRHNKLKRRILKKLQPYIRFATSSIEPSVQLNHDSGTIWRPTSNSRICYAVISDSRWRRLYSVSGTTTAQCESPI